MGLPQSPGEPATTSPPTQTSSTSTKPPTASDLPPEALALATRLFEYARQGQTSELSQYVSAGIPVNLTNHKGDTLIMLAAYHGHLDTVKTLLEKGADMNVLNDRGQSPIAGAVFKGYDEVVRAMVEKGADLYAGQPNAVDAARMFRREGMLELFGVEQ
ncbi:hypothetical protein DOTSEDRAFT_89449 [Lecanosticta acicola]|uniref:Ankyrin n=1 Tax=Lecanosticta acicola TaxID=111012 RepID=A0AAI8YSS6_9PEZI|nr:hypothetical protein DOTSEDRAFT_89449 [Lecanosticta acicola]